MNEMYANALFFKSLVDSCMVARDTKTDEEEFS